MTKYEYSILRYLHDRITGEFINVGIIIYSSDNNTVLSKFIDSSKRISDFFHGVDARRVKRLISPMNSTVRYINKRLQEELNLDEFNNLDNICQRVLPKDDSALFFTDPQKGRTLELIGTLNRLYDEIITKYDSERTKTSISDEDVWRNIYKKHFDRRQITSKLKEKQIETAHDSIKFEYTWQNGKVNIFKPISFNYSNKEIAKNKIYRWDGKLRELLTSEVQITINFLTTRLSNDNDENINKLIKDKLIVETSKLKSRLVYESDIDSFTDSLKEEIEQHN